MSDIDELTRLILAFRDERDWKQFHKPKDLAISLSLEASEVLEHFQWKNDAEFQQHVAKNKTEVEDELADVLAYLLLTAASLDIDLEQAFKSKLKKNSAKYPVDKSKGNHKKYTELNP